MTNGEEKEIICDRALATACHEAAHAVAGMLLGVPFACAEIGPYDADRGGGRVVVDGKPCWAAEVSIACTLAGAAFDSLLRPKASFASVLARSSRCGSCKAAWQARSVLLAAPGGDREGRKKAMGIYLRSKRLVRENWGTIVKVGRALATRKRMTHDEILEAATGPEAACPPDRRPQAGTCTSAGKSKKLRPEEYVALRHWGTCLHEAAHAVMHTKDGHGVSMAEVAVWPSDFGGRGEVVYVGDKPLLSSLVAGYLAQRLWGLSEYYRLCCMRISATADFGLLARLESWKRGSQEITWEDRQAAMQVWQAEYRKLKSRFMRDPTLELQVKAVAKALSLRGTLDGDEVRRAMDEALETCSSPDVPSADSAASHGG